MISTFQKCHDQKDKDRLRNYIKEKEAKQTKAICVLGPSDPIGQGEKWL